MSYSFRSKNPSDYGQVTSVYVEVWEPSGAADPYVDAAALEQFVQEWLRRAREGNGPDAAVALAALTHVTRQGREFLYLTFTITDETETGGHLPTPRHPQED